VWAPDGRPRIDFGFTIRGGKIVEIDLVADPARISQLDLEVLGECLPGEMEYAAGSNGEIIVRTSGVDVRVDLLIPSLV
jgi:hypothetical protein